MCGQLGVLDGCELDPVANDEFGGPGRVLFPHGASSRRISCPACRRPQILTAAESAAYFTLGFIAHPSADSLEAYITNLRTCPERGRRAIACNNIGTIFTRMQDHATATLWHMAALEYNPNFFLPYRNMAKGLTAMREPDRARKVLEAAMEACHPVPPEAFFERVRIGLGRQSPQSVEMDLRRVIQMHPRWSMGYRLLAAVAESRGQYDRGARILDDVIHLALDANDLAMRARLLTLARPFHGASSEAVHDMQLATTLLPEVPTFVRWLEESATGASLVWTP